MSRHGHLWAVAYDRMERADEVRDELLKIGRYMNLVDVAVVVRHPDGSFTINREPLHPIRNVLGTTTLGSLIGLALGGPLTGAAAGALLGAGITVSAALVCIDEDFIREVKQLMKPGTSAVFVLDDEGDMDVILHAIQGLGGTVVKTNVDVERAKLIQSALNAAPGQGTERGAGNYGRAMQETSPTSCEGGGSRMPRKAPGAMRTAVILLAGALTLLGAAQVYANTLEAAKARGTLNVGVRNDFPPLGYLDADGKPTGFEVDLARYLARQLLGDEGKLRLVPVPAGSRLTALVAESADLLIAAVTVTEDRGYLFAFSEPYFISGSLLLVPKHSAIQGLGDLPGKKVAVLEGSLQEGGLRRVAPGATPVNFWRVSEAVAALRAGEVDALAEDDILARALARQYPDLAAVGEPFRPRPYAVAMRKGDPDLLAWVNEQLRKAKADGTLDALWNRYFGDAGAILHRP